MQEKKKRTRKRSPGYPMISLEEAIQRVRILWNKEKNNPVPLEAAFDHLGYKTMGGYGGRVLAAMKQFGLIYQKQNDIILTSDAVDLVLHDQSDDKYIETVKILALKPTIYEKLFNENNGQSDAALKIRLIKEYEFNPDKVNGFLSDFRKTIEFAKLDSTRFSDSEKTSDDDKKVQQNDNLPIKQGVSLKPSTFVPEASEREIANYPIGKGLKARILVSGPSLVTSDSIKKLIGLLQLNENDLPEIADFNLNEEYDTTKN